jgi:hypothetical protein
LRPPGQIALQPGPPSGGQCDVGFPTANRRHITAIARGMTRPCRGRFLPGVAADRVDLAGRAVPERLYTSAAQEGTGGSLSARDAFVRSLAAHQL